MGKAIKILEVSLFKTTASGPTTVLKPIIEKLNAKNFQIDVLSTLQFDSEREKLANDLGAHYFYLKDRYISNYKKLEKIIKDIKSYDLVHIHGVYNLNNILLARLLKKHRIPYILSIHGGLMEEALKKSKYKKKIAITFLIKNMIAHAAAIHALNKNEAKSIAKIYNHPNIKIISNGILIDTFKEEKGEENGKTNLLYIGRIDVYTKGLDQLLKALDTKKFKNTIHLDLVGPYVKKEDKEYVEEKIKSSKTLKNIINLAGPKYGKEKDEYYKNADAFILTSRHEGMPMGVLEAMAKGIAVIVTPGTNMTDIVNESSSGFITELNPDSIAETISKVSSSSKAELYQMGKKAREYCQEELSWDHIAASYGDFYKDTIGKNNK